MKARLDFREIPNTRRNNDVVYYIFSDIYNVGECIRGEDGEWHLIVTSADIKIHGRNRYDLFEKAQMLYDKFMEAHRGVRNE